ncbi:MAG: alkaline phosphatase family protein [Muribaculaceae bacterium]|nr:alkaline phosphatase family protein [Muribaculaceae bacterium]
MKRILTTVLCGLVTLNVAVQASRNDDGRPRLVVGIVVDQLRTDYIEYLQNYFNERGFKRLMKEGAYMRDVDFKAKGLDGVSGTAMLYTGSYPSSTGVAAAEIYDPVSKKMKPVLSDPKTLGNFTNDSYSPETIRLSTLADEIAMDGLGLSAVYSFAADPQMAIVMAGHSGTSACWLNNHTGNWATTTYYKALPTPVSTRNYSSSVASRLDTMQWKPSIPIEKFPGLPEQKKIYPFRHTFPRSDKAVYEQFAASPMGNAEVTDIAIECLRQLKIGSNTNAVDMLNVGYTLAPYRYVSDGDYRPELTDAYLRLDSQLGRLFDAIDQYVGRDKAVIWLSSTGYYDDAVIEDKKYRIPGGEFSLKRAKSLLNSYLSAQHGNADYVEAFNGSHLYFDHKVIDDKKLNIQDVVSDARSFLTRMSGVADAFTFYDILSPSTPEEERLRLSLDPKTGGDIYVSFNPGWTIVNDIDYPVVTKSVRETPVLTPAFIVGPGVAPKTIDASVDATAIAPTVSSILRIRSPNGAVSKPLLLN